MAPKLSFKRNEKSKIKLLPFFKDSSQMVPEIATVLNLAGGGGRGGHSIKNLKRKSVWKGREYTELLGSATARSYRHL